MQSRMLTNPPNHYDAMIDSLIEEFMQHKTRESNLLYRRNLHALTGETTSQFCRV